MSLPRPPIPSDADLRPLPFMPLHVAKLRDSDLAAECEPEACWYAVLLWCAAWHQLPAGSLPNNDTVLCKLIGLGRDLRTFRTHREQALRGWYECDDGRLYHPVVAQEVIKAWRARVEQFWRTECARIKKANQRNGTDLPSPTLEEFLAGRAPATKEAMSQGTLNLVPEDTAECPPVRPEGHSGLSLGKTPPRERDTEQTQKGQGDSNNNNIRESAPPVAVDAFDFVAEADQLARRAGVPHSQPASVARNIEIVREWHRDGIDITATVIPEIDRFRLNEPDRSVSTLRFFDASVRGKLASQAAKARKGAPPAPMANIEPMTAVDGDHEQVRALRRRFAGNITLGPDRVALTIVEDDRGPTVVVTARSAYIAKSIDRAMLQRIAVEVVGTDRVEVLSQ